MSEIEPFVATREVLGLGRQTLVVVTDYRSASSPIWLEYRQGSGSVTGKRLTLVRVATQASHSNLRNHPSCRKTIYD